MKRLESDIDEKHKKEHSSLYYEFKERSLSQSDIFLRSYAELEIKQLRAIIKLRIQSSLEAIELGKHIDDKTRDKIRQDIHTEVVNSEIQTRQKIEYFIKEYNYPPTTMSSLDFETLSNGFIKIQVYADLKITLDIESLNQEFRIKESIESGVKSKPSMTKQLRKDEYQNMLNSLSWLQRKIVKYVYKYEPIKHDELHRKVSPPICYHHLSHVFKNSEVGKIFYKNEILRLPGGQWKLKNRDLVPEDYKFI